MCAGGGSLAALPLRIEDRENSSPLRSPPEANIQQARTCYVGADEECGEGKATAPDDQCTDGETVSCSELSAEEAAPSPPGDKKCCFSSSRFLCGIGRRPAGHGRQVGIPRLFWRLPGWQGRQNDRPVRFCEYP